MTLFGSQPQQQPAQPPKDYTLQFDGMQNQLELMNRMLSQQILPALTPKPPYRQQVTITSAPLGFDSNGYDYAAMLVGSAQTLTIVQFGLTYTVALNPGLNALNLIDGAQISSASSFTAVLIHSDTLITSDPVFTTTATIGGSTVMLPTDIQSHFAQTVPTHNAVSIAAAASSIPATWTDTNGFSGLSFTVMNDATTSVSVSLYWSNDNANQHGLDNVVSASTLRYIPGSAPSMRARYVKLVPTNNDAAAHTMSAWLYLLT